MHRVAERFRGSDGIVRGENGEVNERVARDACPFELRDGAGQGVECPFERIADAVARERRIEIRGALDGLTTRGAYGVRDDERVARVSSQRIAERRHERERVRRIIDARGVTKLPGDELSLSAFGRTRVDVQQGEASTARRARRAALRVATSSRAAPVKREVTRSHRRKTVEHAAHRLDVHVENGCLRGFGKPEKTTLPTSSRRRSLGHG